MKGQRWREGDFVQIPLSETSHAYGRVLRSPLTAFYDLCGDGEISIADLRTANVIFRVWVMKSAVTKGGWRVISHEPLVADLLIAPEFAKQDAINGKITVYREGAERPASFEEASVLEKAAVWDASHVEDRLRDHFAGRPNKWVESLRLKLCA